MKAHRTNTLLVARALENSPVKEVIYPGLATHPRHALAYKSLSPHAKKWVHLIARVAVGDDVVTRDGDDGFPFGGMISCRIRGSTHKFLTATRLFTLA
jgi:cystathionine gamma-lyase